MHRFSRAGFLATVAIIASVPQVAAAQESGGGIETVTVTAERRSEDITKVPESISAFQKDKMDVLGVKNVADLVKFTPGINYDPDSKDISIRGINSDAGSATTGVYIDDTPIQIRNLGFNSNSTLPAIFDLDRVEVLRGPQGTLFGAGSEGGTIRYITPQPSLTDYSVYARSELSFTQNGGPSYEGGAAVGGPISDTLGFRVSAWARQDGGYVDHVDDKTLDLQQGDSNTLDNYAMRAALMWQPVQALTITPSVFFQSSDQANSDDYWVSISRPSSGVFRTGTPEPMKDNDQFYLPSLKADYQFGGSDLIFNASYFTRHENVNGYSGTLYNLSYFQQLVDSGTDPDGRSCKRGFCFDHLADEPPLLLPTGLNLPGYPDNYVSVATITNRQQNFTSEMRLQSTDTGSPLTWVVGAFFQSQHQQSTEQINDPQLPALTEFLWGEDMSRAWGQHLLANGDDYINQTEGHDRQFALFANATYAITDALKLQAGVRAAWTHFSFVNFANGPQDFGFSSGAGASDESPITPMVSVSYQINDSDMVYATFSKGYREGGANAPTPPSCDGDLKSLGLTSAPDSYGSDTVDNYELGTKDSFLDRHLQISGSVFYLNWNNIQQNNYLPTCGIQYTANLGTASSKGFDLQGDWLITDDLELDATLGYVDAYYTDTAFAGPNPGKGVQPLTVKGEALPGSPWTASVGGQYNTSVWGRDAYIRADYEFTGKAYGTGGGYAAGTSSFDPSLVPDPAYSQVSLRAAMQFGNLNMALFANNLFNAHPQLDLNHQDQFTELFEAITLRPRTVGITATYKY
ncbi:MAG TPA: TonB-dependent receptor [Rhizomicrobium sp.]|jgi:outer membrane receptor protein involved in Fe transport